MKKGFPNLVSLAMQLLVSYSRDSAISRLDPRVKILWLIGNAIFTVWGLSPGLVAWNFFVVLFTIRLAGISLRNLLPFLKIMAVIGIQLILLQGLLRTQGSPVFHLGPATFYSEGLLLGAMGVLTLTSLSLLFLQFIMCTTPEEMTLLMINCRLPASSAVLVGLAFRFLPLLERDLREIHESQESRGIALTTTWQKAKGIVTVILPLILRTLRRTHEVSLTMELKGFRLHDTRTFLEDLSFRRTDRLAAAAIGAYFAVVTAVLILMSSL
ncbi:energy-coupling factor transporter transmembrane component T family protein [Desulfomonile tiedjei]|uniref:ABC-type cobalt transport system, permease component CbiQ n=1 Tax=Desulfomonile tiedjei (strain ATCC 49306 / DSM 6799 / DCB-1) TaxID=706587 RepID=I4CD92_DESTA|nr:energy-coupling factor transporter transmembrane component T [Desulfomonile tiedjei]AFM27533.1 ABC-type cobalt transport system, permease component CbiQ [Desulfomonile tiedjei DSM 6799]